MPDVSSTAPAEVKFWVALDVHKNSIVAAVLPASGATPRVAQIETTERAIRRFVHGLGDSATIAVCFGAGPRGYELLRLLARLGVACDVVAPSLVRVQAGAPVKTDCRDAKKLVTLYRAGALSFVAPPGGQDAGALWARLSRGQEVVDQGASGLGAPPAARQSTRAGGARTPALPPRRGRRPACRAPRT
jgi:transposase